MRRSTPHSDAPTSGAVIYVQAAGRSLRAAEDPAAVCARYRAAQGLDVERLAGGGAVVGPRAGRPAGRRARLVSLLFLFAVAAVVILGWQAGLLGDLE